MNENCTTVNIIGPCEVDKSSINTTLHSIVVDGGLNHKITFQDYISIGDGDSTKSSLEQKCQHLLPEDKNESDLHHALKLIPTKAKKILLHGFLGGRQDHQLMNLAECSHYIDKEENFEKNLHFYKDKERFISILGPNTWVLEYFGVFSLFSFIDQNVVLFGDVKYRLGGEYTQVLSAYTSLGLSNSASGQFTLKNQRPILIFWSQSQIDAQE